MTWIYNDEIVIIPPLNTIGFVYCITAPTGHKYIGRKICTSKRKKTIKGKVKRVIVDSDWRKYCGSSEEVKELVKKYGIDSFKREILYWCKDKSSMAYLEMKTIFERDALLKDEYLNKWITCRINAKNLNSLKT